MKRNLLGYNDAFPLFVLGILTSLILPGPSGPARKQWGGWEHQSRRDYISVALVVSCTLNDPAGVVHIWTLDIMHKPINQSN